MKKMEVLDFTNVNVNPKGKRTGDCSTRAIANTLGISWEQALKEQFEVSLKTKYGISMKQVTERVLKKYGYIKMKQPRKLDGRKYRVYELCDILTDKQMEEGVLVAITGHNTCIKDYTVQDIWDCRNYIVGNYYVKGGE